MIEPIIIPSGTSSATNDKGRVVIQIPHDTGDVRVSFTTEQALILQAKLSHAIKEALYFRKYQAAVWKI